MDGETLLNEESSLQSTNRNACWCLERRVRKCSLKRRRGEHVQLTWNSRFMLPKKKRNEDFLFGQGNETEGLQDSQRGEMFLSFLQGSRMDVLVVGIFGGKFGWGREINYVRSREIFWLGVNGKFVWRPHPIRNHVTPSLPTRVAMAHLNTFTRKVRSNLRSFFLIYRGDKRLIIG